MCHHADRDKEVEHNGRMKERSVCFGRKGRDEKEDKKRRSDCHVIAPLPPCFNVLRLTE